MGRRIGRVAGEVILIVDQELGGDSYKSERRDRKFPNVRKELGGFLKVCKSKAARGSGRKSRKLPRLGTAGAECG